MKVKKIIQTIVAVCMISTVFVGCGVSKSKDYASGLPEVVNIGTQQMPNDEGIAKAKGYFEEELGVKVNLVEFDSGKDVNNALISGSIDFGLLGSSPATLGVANESDVEIIWIHEVLGKVESLVVKNGSNINSPEGLVGKKVVTPFASTAHYSLLNALKINGINEADIELLDMQPADIYAAWQRGDIDAAYVWEPTLANLLEDGKILLSSEDMAARGVITSNVEVVRKEFSEKYPDLVTKYIKALDKSVKLYNEKQDEAVNVIADALQISEKDALSQMQGSIWLTAEEQLDSKYFGTSDSKGELVNSLKDTANFLFAQKNITSVPEDSVFEKSVNPKYIEESIK